MIENKAHLYEIWNHNHCEDGLVQTADTLEEAVEILLDYVERYHAKLLFDKYNRGTKISIYEVEDWDEDEWYHERKRECLYWHYPNGWRVFFTDWTEPADEIGPFDIEGDDLKHAPALQ